MPFWCLCFGIGLSRVPVSRQSSSVPAVAVPVPLTPELPAALALLCEPRDVATEELDVPWPGATVTVDPSGIVVVPLNPFGPEVTLLDMPPDRATEPREESAVRSRPATGAVSRDAALADVALDSAPFATAQERLVWRSADAP